MAASVEVDSPEPPGPEPPASGPPESNPPEPEPPGRSWADRLLLAATWLVVGLGVALRIRQWLAARSFWADESSLWLVTVHAGYGRLTRPLAAGQAAPIGWLWSEYLVMSARRARPLVVLLLPLLVLLTAAIRHAYPASDRLALFAVPTVLLVLCAPVSLLRWYPRRAVTALATVPAAAAIAGIAVLAAPGVEQALTYTAHPLLNEETRPVLQYIANHYRPGDLVLFDQSSIPVSVYGPRVGLPTAAVRIVTPSHGACRRPGATEATIKARYGRVWFAYGHQFSGLPAYTRDGYRAHLATIGRHVDTLRETGAGADLYDLRAPPDDPGRSAPILRLAVVRCLAVRGL